MRQDGRNEPKKTRKKDLRGEAVGGERDGFTLLTPGLLADLGVEAWPNHLVASSVMVALSCWRLGMIGRRRRRRIKAEKNKCSGVHEGQSESGCVWDLINPTPSAVTFDF
jgi:hypothetical protein